MNTRIADIARELAERGQTTLAELARRHGVSERTIRNDLKTLNAELAKLAADGPTQSIQDDGAAGPARSMRDGGAAGPTRVTQVGEPATQTDDVAATVPVITLARGGVVRAPEGLNSLLPELTGAGGYDYRLSSDERVRIAATLLVSHAGYLTLSAIAEALYVSRGTVIGELDRVKALIAEAGLVAVSHPSRGIRVDGLESVKRAFLLRMLEELPKRRESPDEANTTDAADARQVSIQAGNPKVISKIVAEQETSHSRWLTGDSFQRVVRYLRIAVSRMLAGEVAEPQDVPENSWYPMASDILRYVAQYCGVTTTRDEALVLARLLSHAQFLRQEAPANDAPVVQLVTRQFIDRVSEELGIRLDDDFDLFEKLANHLESTLQPSPVAYPDTPVIRRVIAENDAVVQAVLRRDAILRGFAGRDLTELEVGYIALHLCAAIERKRNQEQAFCVAIACNAGVGTSQLLFERLRRHFSFRIVDTVASHEVGDLDPAAVDLVITTVPLGSCPVESVLVSPLLTDDDYVRVGAKVEALRNSRNLPTHVDDDPDEAKELIRALSPVVHEVAPDVAPVLMRRIRRVIRRHFDEREGAGTGDVFAPYLHQLIIPSHILLDAPAADWREAVRVSARPLLAEGYIEPRYIDAMIANIEENGPYVVLSPGFAMPHEGLDKGAIETGMSFVRLAEPVPFDADEFDPVEFVCCLSAADKKTHLKAFFALVNIIRDDTFKQALREARTPDEVTRIFERYEYGAAS